MSLARLYAVFLISVARFVFVNSVILNTRSDEGGSGREGDGGGEGADGEIMALVFSLPYDLETVIAL